MMSLFAKPPRVLVVTPEVALIPGGLRKFDRHGNTLKIDFANNLADLICALYREGIRVYVAQPDYRRIFLNLLQNKHHLIESFFPDTRLYLAEDRVFFYANPIHLNGDWENIKISIVFQREVINQIIPLVRPNLIHCHHWMTGLIPAAARQLRIPCLFTVDTPHSAKSTLSYIEDLGIDAAKFWQNLYYEQFPTSYEETRESNPAFFLLSGIFAASFVTVASPSLTVNIADIHGNFFTASLGQVLTHKWQTGCAATFNQSVNVQQYIRLYERMCNRSVTDCGKKANISVFAAKSAIHSP